MQFFYCSLQITPSLCLSPSPSLSVSLFYHTHLSTSIKAPKYTSSSSAGEIVIRPEAHSSCRGPVQMRCVFYPFLFFLSRRYFGGSTRSPQPRHKLCLSLQHAYCSLTAVSPVFASISPSHRRCHVADPLLCERAHLFHFSL
jgi:hypothetical protein